MPVLEKKKLRLLMKERRAQLFRQYPEAGNKISTLFFEYFNLPCQSVVGGYWPIGSELDVRPLLYKLKEKGFMCALPCIAPQGMVFRLWAPSVPLIEGNFHIFEPPSHSPEIVPDLLLIPLLAFDKEGHRLGYGQGHFDRFLHQHSLVTVGVGFKGQEVETVPVQSHDFVLDYVLTEEGIIS